MWICFNPPCRDVLVTSVAMVGCGAVLPGLYKALLNVSLPRQSCLVVRTLRPETPAQDSLRSLNRPAALKSSSCVDTGKELRKGFRNAASNLPAKEGDEAASSWRGQCSLSSNFLHLPSRRGLPAASLPRIHALEVACSRATPCGANILLPSLFDEAQISVRMLH
jgi:hypothetical protein